MGFDLLPFAEALADGILFLLSLSRTQEQKTCSSGARKVAERLTTIALIKVGRFLGRVVVEFGN